MKHVLIFLLFGISSAFAQKEAVYDVIEKQAVFPGGTNGYLKYMADSLRYPEAAANAKIDGRVFAKFTVTRFGTIKDIEILKGIGYGCEEEAIRFLKSMPRWTPGSQNGVNVSSKFTLPIHFYKQ